MARSGIALLCAVGTVLLAAVAFVGSPLSGPRAAPRLRSTTYQALPNGLSETSADDVKLSAEQDSASSFLKWVAAGVLAGMVMAVSTEAANASAFQGVKFAPEGYTIKNSKILQPCKDSKKYNKKFKDQLYKITQKQKKYAAGTAVQDRLQRRLELAQKRQEAYGTRLCGKHDGFPRTIATGEMDVRGSAVYPAFMFLYTAGWIGWSGREYLLRTSDAEKEIKIDVPLALTCMASGFAWPVNSWIDIVNGDFVVPDNMIHRSSAG